MFFPGRSPKRPGTNGTVSIFKTDYNVQCLIYQELKKKKVMLVGWKLVGAVGKSELNPKPVGEL